MAVAPFCGSLFEHHEIGAGVGRKQRVQVSTEQDNLLLGNAGSAVKIHGRAGRIGNIGRVLVAAGTNEVNRVLETQRADGSARRLPHRRTT